MTIKTETPSKKVKTKKKSVNESTSKEVPPTPQNGKGEFAETNQRIIHRYYLALEELGIDKEELNGASPADSRKVFKDCMREMQEKRTEEEVLLQSGRLVTLGEKNYEIPPLTFNRTKKFRERCGVFAKNLFDFIVEHASRPEDKTEGDGPRYEVLDIMTEKTGINIHSLLQKGMPYITGEGFEEIVELLFLCSDELAADREEILENADIVQLSKASLEVYRIALPFVGNLFQGMMISYGHAKTVGMPGIR